MITAPMKWAIAVVMVLVLGILVVVLGVLILIGAISADTAQEEARREETCSPLGIVLAFDPDAPVRNPMTGGFVVTSEYGMRVQPVLRIRRLHAGIDFAQTGGNGPIVAAGSGQVVNAGFRPGAGNNVEIDHGGGVRTRYLHLSRVDVTEDQTVTSGEQIGLQGNTGGISTGAHLHFEVRLDGEPTDPRPWLAQRGVTLPAVGVAAQAPGVGQAGEPNASAQAKDSALIEQAAVPSANVPDAVGAYSGEQLVNAGHIIDQGQQLGLDRWSITVAVMTAMGESTLVNVDYGDDVGPDSRGLFQQRNSWGTEAQRMDPPTAARFFYEALQKVQGYTDLAPTIAAHRTQRNADPYHYEKYWADAVRVVAVITGDDSFLSALPASGSVASEECEPGEVQAAAAGAGGELPQECEPSGSPAEAGLTPTALRLLRCTVQEYPTETIYGVGEREGPNEHASGSAVDFMIEDFRSAQGNARGREIAEWVVSHADELDVDYVIFDMRIWHPKQGWGTYDRYGATPDDTLAHRDHVHVSVNESTTGQSL